MIRNIVIKKEIQIEECLIIELEHKKIIHFMFKEPIK